MVTAAQKAFASAKGNLAQKLSAALLAAENAGGDAARPDAEVAGHEGDGRARGGEGGVAAEVGRGQGVVPQRVAVAVVVDAARVVLRLPTGSHDPDNNLRHGVLRSGNEPVNDDAIEVQRRLGLTVRSSLCQRQRDRVVELQFHRLPTLCRPGQPQAFILEVLDAALVRVGTECRIVGLHRKRCTDTDAGKCSDHVRTPISNQKVATPSEVVKV